MEEPEPAIKQLMVTIGREMLTAIKDHGCRTGRRYGFAILVFGLSENEKDHMSYVCNCGTSKVTEIFIKFVVEKSVY